MKPKYTVLPENHILMETINGATNEARRLFGNTAEDNAMIVYEVTPVWRVDRKVTLEETKIERQS